MEEIQQAPSTELKLPPIATNVRFERREKSSVFYILDLIAKGLHRHVASSKVTAARIELDELKADLKGKNINPPAIETLEVLMKHMEKGEWDTLEKIWKKNLKVAFQEFGNLIRVVHDTQENQEEEKIIQERKPKRRRPFKYSSTIPEISEPQTKRPFGFSGLRSGNTSVLEPHPNEGDGMESEEEERENEYPYRDIQSRVSNMSSLSMPAKLVSELQRAYQLGSMSERGWRGGQNKGHIIRAQQVEIQDLAGRLSHMVSEKVKSGSKSTVDPRDDTNPYKLKERFSELYDKEWEQANEELMDSRKYKEKEIIDKLLFMVQRAQYFCRATAESQLQQLTANIKETMAHHSITGNTKQVPIPRQVEADKLADSVIRSEIPSIKHIQKRTASISLPRLKHVFRQKVMDEMFKAIPAWKCDKLKQYIDGCLEIVWMMSVQDPPMHLEYCIAGQKSPRNFQPHVSRGTVVVTCVWPALYLYEGGPNLSKGLAKMN